MIVDDIASDQRNALVGGPFGSNLVSKDYVDSGIPVIRGQNLGTGRWVAGEFAFVTKEKAESLSANLARPGDLVFTQRGTLGQVAIIPSEPYNLYLISQSQMKLTADSSKANALYLYYEFTSPRQQAYIDTNAIRVGVPHTNLGILRNTPLSLPDPEEQKRIAHILGTLDDKIELNRRMSRTLEAMAQAIFKSWFVDFEPVKAKAAAKAAGASPEKIERAAMAAIAGKTEAELDQLPQAQKQSLAKTAALFPDSFQESELGEIPEGWEIHKIGDVVNRISVGKKYSQKTASESGDVPILDQGKSGIIGYHSDVPGVKASQKDPIIAFANHTCYMRLIMHDFSAIQNVLPFKSKEGNIFWLFCATMGKQEFIEYKGHWPEFQIKEIVQPDSSLEENFGELSSSFFERIYANEAESCTLAQLRDTLLPKLLSGELSILETQSQTEEVNT